MRHAYVLTCLLLLLPQLSYSQEEKSKDDKDAVTVVVTASRGEKENILDVPQSIQVIERADLDSATGTDVDQITRTIPGVSLAPAEGNPNYFQEGFTVRGLGGQRVLTLTDGIRQAGQGVGYGGGNLSLYDPFAVERIEVLKGPGSILYGTDAFGGVVNVITRNPTERDVFGSNGGVSYLWDGQYQKHRVGTYVDVGDANSATLFGGSFTSSGGPDLPDAEDNRGGDFTKWSLFGKSKNKISDDASVTFIGNWDRTLNIGIEDTAMPLPVASFPPPGSSELVFTPLRFEIPVYQRSLVGVELNIKDLSVELENLKTGVYWQQLQRQLGRETGYYAQGNPGFAGPPLFVNPSATVNESSVLTNDKVNTFEWNTQALYDAGENDITAGLDVGYDTTYLPENEMLYVIGIPGQGQIGPQFISSTRRVRADADQYRIGLYAKDTINADAFEFTPGVRADYFNVQDNLTTYSDNLFGVSGSVGTAYKITEQHRAFLDVGTGFRAPDLGERFQNGVVNFGVPTRIIGQHNLDPERAYNAELGFKGEEKRKYSYEVAAFGTKVNKYIGPKQLGTVDGFVTEQYQNLGDVSLYGGEFGGTVSIDDGFELYANGARTWTQARDKLDVPSWVFQYGPRYTIGINQGMIKDVAAALNFRTVLRSPSEIERPGQDPFDAPGFTVVDLDFVAVSQETCMGDGKLLFGIKNILDKEYEEPFFTRRQPERNLYAGVQFDF